MALATISPRFNKEKTKTRHFGRGKTSKKRVRARCAHTFGAASHPVTARSLPWSGMPNGPVLHTPQGDTRGGDRHETKGRSKKLREDEEARWWRRTRRNCDSAQPKTWDRKRRRRRTGVVHWLTSPGRREDRARASGRRKPSSSGPFSSWPLHLSPPVVNARSNWNICGSWLAPMEKCVLSRHSSVTSTLLSWQLWAMVSPIP